MTIDREGVDGQCAGDDDSVPSRIPMRQPCRYCGHELGVIDTRGGQDTVWCARCEQYAGYNAPRTETGRPRRSLATRPGISVSQRTRILLRDNRACFLCHRRDVPLDVGHMVSVHDGRKWGLPESELFGDDNQIAMCAACNSGLRRATIPWRFLVAAWLLWAAQKEGPDAA